MTAVLDDRKDDDDTEKTQCRFDPGRLFPEPFENGDRNIYFNDRSQEDPAQPAENDLECFHISYSIIFVNAILHGTHPL